MEYGLIKVLRILIERAKKKFCCDKKFFLHRLAREQEYYFFGLVAFSHRKKRNAVCNQLCFRVLSSKFRQHVTA